MESLYSLIALLAVNALAFFVTRALRPRTHVESLLTYAVVLAVAILFTGYLTSAVVHFNDVVWWAGAAVVLGVLAVGPLMLHPATRARCLRKVTIPRDIERRILAAGVRRFDTVLLLILGIVVAIVAFANFLLLILCVPAATDALEYHLPRMAYYLQAGSMAPYHAIYWAQIVYPKASTVLITFSYLMSGRQESLTQLPQFLAYGICLLVIYGVSRHMGATRRGAMFAAFIIGLLPVFITEAPTALNDLILTAFAGITLYFLVAYRSSRSLTHLAPAAAALAFVSAIKGTVLLVFPAVGLIALWAMVAGLRKQKTLAWSHVPLTLLFLIVAFATITVPSGYWDNVRLFGDPFGPKSVRANYTPEKLNFTGMARAAALNSLRYGAEFLRPDALVPLPGADAFAYAWASGMKKAFAVVGLNLEDMEGARTHFAYFRSPVAYENESSWGFFGFLLVWPAACIALFARRRPFALRVLVLCALLTIFASGLLLLYDPFHGRFLTAVAVMVAPALAFIPLQGAAPQTRGKRILRVVWRAYLVLAVAVGCFSAFIAAFFHSGSPFISYHRNGHFYPAPFSMLRTAQIVRDDPSGWLTIYEVEVPEDATVAVDVSHSFPEYLLFGPRLQRHIIPIRSFMGMHRMAPPEAQYVVCDDKSPYNQAGTMMMTEDDYPYYPLILRRLK